jgi:hypothetical protein
MAVKLHLPAIVWLALSGALGTVSAEAVPVSSLEVRIVTGAQELSAGSSLELRIYEAGKSARHLPLVHGEAWARDSTHIIPVTLNEALDPRSVVRFSLYYRSANPLMPNLEIVAADVELPSGKEAPALLLDATLSGVVGRQSELATMDRLQERCGLRRQAKLQRTRALCTSLTGRRCARMREGNAGGVSRQSGMQRRRGLPRVGRRPKTMSPTSGALGALGAPNAPSAAQGVVQRPEMVLGLSQYGRAV